MSIVLSSRRLLIGVFAVILCGGVGCGGDTGHTATASPHTTSPRAPSTHSETPTRALAKKSAKKIFAAAHTALRSARSFHIKGGMRTDRGDMRFELTVTKDAAQGTVTVIYQKKPVKIDVIRVGDDEYIRSKELARRIGGAEVARRFGKRWMHSPKGFFEYDPTRFTPKHMADFIKLKPHPKKGDTPTDTYKGKSVIILHDSKGDSLYVVAVGKPYVMRYVTGEDAHHEVSSYMLFTDYDAPLVVERPAHPVDIPAP